MVALSKSQNKHNRLYMQAEPMDEEVTKAVEDGKIGPRDDFKIRARLLADEYGWDVTDARKIWCFGPDGLGANFLVDTTKVRLPSFLLSKYCDEIIPADSIDCRLASTTPGSPILVRDQGFLRFRFPMGFRMYVSFPLFPFLRPLSSLHSCPFSLCPVNPC